LISVQEEYRDYSGYGWAKYWWADGLSLGTVVTDDAGRRTTWEVRVNGNILEAELMDISVHNEMITSSLLKLWSSDNHLFINSPQETFVKIYTLSGALFVQQRVAAGTTNISVPQGIYIVTDGNQTMKIIVK